MIKHVLSMCLACTGPWAQFLAEKNREERRGKRRVRRGGEGEWARVGEERTKERVEER